jgi:hypothetical protein
MARWSKDRKAATVDVGRSATEKRQGGRGAATGTLALQSAAPQDPWGTLRREIDRARRYCRPLVLLQVAPRGKTLTALPIDAAVHPRPWRRFRAAAVVDPDVLDFLRDCLRIGDELWTDSGRIFVMLPEADESAARGLVTRLRARAPHIVGDWEFSAASFPEHGFTSGALLSRLADGTEPTSRRISFPLPSPAREIAANMADDIHQLRAG